MIQIKRIYENYDVHDGYRVLIDRIWPRGISKEKAHLDEWAKEVAPSTALRQWFNHEPKKYKAFTSKYLAELQDKKDWLTAIKKKAMHHQVTLLYGAKDKTYNQAQVLLALLKE